jgi:hypothetical protein
LHRRHRCRPPPFDCLTHKEHLAHVTWLQVGNMCMRDGPCYWLQSKSDRGFPHPFSRMTFNTVLCIEKIDLIWFDTTDEEADVFTHYLHSLGSSFAFSGFICLFRISLLQGARIRATFSAHPNFLNIKVLNYCAICTNNDAFRCTILPASRDSFFNLQAVQSRFGSRESQGFFSPPPCPYRQW